MRLSAPFILVAGLLVALPACQDSAARTDTTTRAKQPVASATRDASPPEGGLARVPGLQVEVVEEGSGTRAAAGKTAQMHYTGTFMDGEEFDSSRKSGRPFEFRIGAGRVIKGWDMAVAKMRVGDRWIVTIPPEFAYGRKGYPGAIPPNATLKFDMELVGLR